MTATFLYQELRRRLRLTKPEIATATGFSLGYVNRWGHAGPTAITPPGAAVDRLAALLRERALRDLADTDSNMKAAH